ncbi:MAG: O-antigen ligase family protein [Verrucomicrobiales bacterium]
MGNALTLLLAAIVFCVVALIAAVQLGSGDYSVAATLVVLVAIAFAALIFGRKRPFEAVVLTVAVSCYLLLGRGFAYQRIGSIFFAGELVLAFCLLSYLARFYQGRFTLLPRSPLSLPLFLLGFYSLIHLVFDYQAHGFLALRDSCVIYYTLFFFVSYQLGRIEGVDDFVAKALLVMSPFVLIADLLHGYAPGIMSAARSIKVGDVPLLLPHPDATTSTVFGLFLWLYFKSTHGARAPVPWFIGAVAVLGYLVVGARGAAYVAIAALLGFLLLAGQRRFLFLGLPCVAVVAAVLLFALESADPTVSRANAMREQMKAIVTVGSGQSQSADTTKWRLGWWRRITTDVMATNPLFGLGFGVDIYSPFHREFFRTPHVSEDQTRVRGAHNAFFTLLARGGIIGAALFLWVVAAQLWYFWRAAKATESGLIPPRHLFFWGFSISGFVITFFQYTWEAPYSAIPFWTCFGMACASLDKQIEEAKEPEEEEVEAQKPVLAGRLLPAR